MEKAWPYPEDQDRTGSLCNGARTQWHRPLRHAGRDVYGMGNFYAPKHFTDALWAHAAEIGLPLDRITAEHDTPQFEFTLTFDNAVNPMDSVVLFPRAARKVAVEYRILQISLPKPIIGKGGSGHHVNLSFTDTKDHNAIANGERGDPNNLNTHTSGCIAGWMKHHKALAGLVAPNALSYSRLQPASLSGYWCN